MFTFVIVVTLSPYTKLPPYCARSTNMISCAARMWFCYGAKCQNWIAYQLKFKEVFIASTSCPCRIDCVLSICLGLQTLSLRHWNTGFFLATLKYWVGVLRTQYYLMWRRYLFSLSWSPAYWLCHNKNT